MCIEGAYLGHRPITGNSLHRGLKSLCENPSAVPPTPARERNACRGSLRDSWIFHFAFPPLAVGCFLPRLRRFRQAAESSAGGDLRGASGGGIQVQARVHSERRAIIQETAARPFGFGQDFIRLL